MMLSIYPGLSAELRFLYRALIACCLIWLCVLNAQAEDIPADIPADIPVDACLGCHLQSHPQVKNIFATPHGVQADANAPMGAVEKCSACHGDVWKHLQHPEQVKPEITFTDVSSVAMATRNAACLSCHQNTTTSHWMYDTHHSNGVGCSSCHNIHVAEDPVLNPVTQGQVCLSCHSDVRHDLHKASSHPMEKAGVSCSSCHAAHGSLQEKMIRRMTVNQTCYQCHADKRGPFLWEHAPVRENCLDCHAAHGSNQKGMLTTRAPFLCQQCHSMALHPALAMTADGINGGAMNNRYLLLKGCVNCHSAVHGSNHPSGVKLQR